MHWRGESGVPGAEKNFEKSFLKTFSKALVTIRRADFERSSRG